MWMHDAVVPAEGSGYGAALGYLAIAAAALVILAPIAVIIGRDARRHRRNGWGWGLLFLWQPLIVGVIYVIVRRRPRDDRPVTAAGVP
jgi:hypothetical protein